MMANDDAQHVGGDAQNQVRIRIWHKYYDEYPDEPDETVTVEYDDPHLWQDDPWFDSGPTAFDVHPDDAPATLYIYTNDSVRAPPVQENHIDTAEWGRPIERGLPFDPERYDDYPPFGCEVWGRVLFLVEEGLTR
jgi:hypothetical protein